MNILKNLNLSFKFIPPLLVGTMIAIGIGGVFIINEAKQSSKEQTKISKVAFSVEQQRAKAALLNALNSKADSVGRFMAKTSPDLIISYDFTGLKAFQLEAAKDTDVVYATFIKPDGKSAMTDYKKPKDLSHIVERRYTIKNDGDTLGYVLLGMSTKSVNEGAKISNERISNAIKKVNESSKESMTRLFAIMGGTALAIMAMITGLLIILFRKYILNPLKDTTVLVNSLAQGNGDLTVTLPLNGNDEIDQLKLGVNVFVESIRNMIEIIVSEVQYLSKETVQLNTFSRELSNQSEQQRSQTTQVATAMNEMVATVSEVSRNVQEAANAANEGREQSEKGKAVVASTVSSIRHLSQEVESAAQVIADLSESSERIGSVLDVINGIAEQTNLLALNAAIEAARAGEQGRGFAVVADEVRTLASRTHVSTLEIREMIERVQSGTSDAVSAMERGQAAAKESVEQAENAGTSLELIHGVVQNINQMTIQIAAAAEEQNTTTDEINRNIETINSISEESAHGAEQTARGTSELSDLANRLNDLVGQFKIN